MTRKVLLFEGLMIVGFTVAILMLYSRLPESVPDHWGFDMTPNGYGPKWELFLLGPGVMAGISLLTWLGPWMSPERFQVGDFLATWNRCLAILFSLIVYLSGVMVWGSMGHTMEAGRAVEGGIFLMIAALGNELGKVRRNFFLGIKTPWTLASERVWNATHRLTAKMFFAGGLLGVGLTLVGLVQWPPFVLLVAALVPVVYSFVLYKKLQKVGEL